jgi:hypothetical protein
MCKTIYGFRVYGPSRKGSYGEYGHCSVEVEPFEVRSAAKELVANAAYGGCGDYYLNRLRAVQHETPYDDRERAVYYKPQGYHRVAFTWQSDRETESGTDRYGQACNRWYACGAEVMPRPSLVKVLSRIAGQLPAEFDEWRAQPWDIIAILRKMGMKPMKWVEIEGGGDVFVEDRDFDWECGGLRPAKKEPELPARVELLAEEVA